MVQQRRQRRFQSGEIQEPGLPPRTVRLFVDDVSEVESIVTVATTTYTVESAVFVMVDDDTAGAAVTVTLPPVNEMTGKTITVKKLGTTGSVTIDGNSTELIDGSGTNVLSSQYDSVTIVSGTDEWYVI